MIPVHRLPPEAIERIKDFMFGDQEYWKAQYSTVMKQLKAYQPEEVIKRYFSKQYYRSRHVAMDVYKMMDDLFPEYGPRILVVTFMTPFEEYIEYKHPNGWQILEFMEEYFRLF